MPTSISTIDFRVRYQETDQMGVVYHANYLVWFEMGRTNLLRGLGYSYNNLEKQGVVLPVVDVQARYRSPARFDDVISVETQIKELTPRKIEFDYVIRHKEEQRKLCVGSTRHLWVSTQSMRSVLIDQQQPVFYQKLTSYLGESKKG